MDLTAYQSQIKELIPLRNSPEYNDMLDKILFGESNSDKFLIKMEVSRLTTPCQRLIDLREKVLDTCILFKQGNINHYLTKPSIKVLQDNLQLYGLYTVGVFESVHEFISQQKAQQQIQIQKGLKKENIITEHQCELLALSEKNKRGAPRMFYVSELSVTTEDGQKFAAQTSNISSTGMKIKLKDDIHTINKSTLLVTFIGLALEYSDKVLTTPIKYQLIKQENNTDDFSYFYLSCTDKSKPFALFISDFIRQNQYKYKIDVQYYYQLAKISALKHAYLAQMNSLPIYLDSNSKSPFCFALENEANKQSIQDWQCNGKDQLALLFSTSRLAKLIAILKNKSSTTVYTFTHMVNGKEHFLCAIEEELHELGLKEQFIQSGFHNSSWRTYHLSLMPFKYKSANHYNVTESIPDVFNKITHLASLTPLREAFPFKVKPATGKAEINRLNQFIEQSKTSLHADSVFSLFSKELRKEERYEYTSKITAFDSNKQYTGHIADFSFSGLKIKLDQISHFSVSSIITVNLTELQTKSKAFCLTELKYKVVRTSAKSVLHLQVYDQATLDRTQAFFSVLVRNNAKHFTCHPLQAKKQPLQKQLIEIAEDSFTNIVFFVSKVAARPTVNFSAIDLPNHPLANLFALNSTKKNELNYNPIANNHLFERLVTSPLRERADEAVSKEALIYIKVDKDEKNDWHINSFLDEDFKSQKEKLMFIKESQLNATFYALHYRLTEIPQIDMSYIKAEVRAISRFALHLTKKLEEKMMAVEGIIEITDRTNDVINTVKSSLN
jgi:hypothetical protein